MDKMVGNKLFLLFVFLMASTVALSNYLVQFPINYFDLENVYLWLNFGVLPLWLSLIFFPNSKINQIFISSIFLPIIFGLMSSKVIKSA